MTSVKRTFTVHFNPSIYMAAIIVIVDCGENRVKFLQLVKNRPNGTPTPSRIQVANSRAKVWSYPPT